MRNFIKLICSLSLLLSLSVQASLDHAPIDLPFDASFEEYRRLYIQHQLQSAPSAFVNIKSVNEDSSIEVSISAGERLHTWLEVINAKRSEHKQIRLTKENKEPILDKYKSLKKPSENGPSTIHKQLVELLEELPKPMVKVIYEGHAITSSALVSDIEFAKWGQKVSLTYQRAVRWVSLSKWKDWYTKRRLQDVRGYFHLNNYVNLNKKLSNVNKLSEEEKIFFEQNLVIICMNNFSSSEDSEVVKKRCSEEYKLAFSKDDLVSYKNSYWRAAQRTWDSYFEISRPRNDTVWSVSQPNKMTIPFKSIGNEKISNWLEINVEDEFKVDGWALDIQYTNQAKRGTSYLKFKKNTTAHVAEGNIIVMDENQSIDEYNTSWVIRHEFGHILRLPDCYFEFFDPEKNVFIFYSIDMTDLMCSRRGKMNKRIYNELKRVYFKK